ncbi:hypothetical protein ANN_00570 [Periplaneta americana]|uniref:HAT C-terminal dimerisation domain-containing protein n=1 Tax=Periplaneta americana TaxID=6978 RepID=A0ABQ8TRB8_PERAM|nr:hypothetical protein ANN_00570 [Periplaneta americana]
MSSRFSIGRFALNGVREYPLITSTSCQNAGINDHGPEFNSRRWSCIRLMHYTIGLGKPCRIVNELVLLNLEIPKLKAEKKKSIADASVSGACPRAQCSLRASVDSVAENGTTSYARHVSNLPTTIRNLSTSTKCYLENDERDSKRTRMMRRDSKDKCNEHSERERQSNPNEDNRELPAYSSINNGHHKIAKFLYLTFPIIPFQEMKTKNSCPLQEVKRGANLKRTTKDSHPSSTSLADFDRTISSLTSVPGNVGDKVNEKTANILSKIPGYYQLKEIQDILKGKTLQKPTKFSTEQLTAFVQAPFTSCDVERSFSRYKAMLRDNRRRMTTENIRHCLVVNCNSINGAFSNEASTSKSIN